MSAPRLLLVDLAAASVNWSLPPWGEDRIREAAGADWSVRFARSTPGSAAATAGEPSPEALDAAPEAEAYFGFGLSKKVFAGASRLRWVHTAAVGVRGLLFPEMRASAVLLTNSAGVMTDPIAEHVVGGVLYLLRAFDVAVELQRRASWDKSPFVGAGSPIREVGECRVLVVGTGSIGQGIARRLAALGATCTGIRRRPELGAPEGFARVAGPEAFDDEVTRADIVVLAAPHTPETHALLDGRRLDCLPPQAIVVNVARGALLDEDALAERVRAGRLRGAVLDVFREEPLPASSPLWGLPSVLATPHVSAVSPRRFWERELELFLDNWSRYRAGEALRNLVDKEAGY